MSVRQRNPEIEAHLMDVAARAAGRVTPEGGGDDLGLGAFAASRVWPGGIRTEVDWDREAREEAADLANYLMFAMQQDFAGYLRGESEASARYERRMRTLKTLVVLWWDLHTVAA